MWVRGVEDEREEQTQKRALFRSKTRGVGSEATNERRKCRKADHDRDQSEPPFCVLERGTWMNYFADVTLETASAKASHSKSPPSGVFLLARYLSRWVPWQQAREQGGDFSAVE